MSGLRAHSRYGGWREFGVGDVYMYILIGKLVVAETPPGFGVEFVFHCANLVVACVFVSSNSLIVVLYC